MDAHADNEWLAQLDLNTAVLLPTRGLVSHFNEQYAAAQIATDQSVWEPPQLLVWADYLGLLWQKNKAQLAQQKGVFNLISPQQSLLLWTQVIEKSRRNEQSLILLNVQQTVVAVQRSWRLLHEWQVDSESLAQDHVADTEQLLRWIDDYRALLAKRGLVDQAWLQSMLLELDGLVFPFSKLAWREYDLITAVQTRLNQRASELGIDVDVQRK